MDDDSFKRNMHLKVGFIRSSNNAEWQTQLLWAAHIRQLQLIRVDQAVSNSPSFRNWWLQCWNGRESRQLAQTPRCVDYYSIDEGRALLTSRRQVGLIPRAASAGDISSGVALFQVDAKLLFLFQLTDYTYPLLVRSV